MSADSCSPTVEERLKEIERALYVRGALGDVDSADVSWLIAELRGALSELSAARRDAERLDWLEKHGEALSVSRFVRLTAGRTQAVSLTHNPSPRISAGAGGDTIREAIDRGMAFNHPAYNAAASRSEETGQ